ncbi:hypothetical protein Q4493_06515 [Colwellia sp. 1_MG-2023]|uniref:hypothetical protein n=1 Tax=Colwellia sp. 1_MG-2023 TaxID=3062649 RepID=UPI0026E41464|nr:hypothetical protein [Colwellia sp. 1_MG-2023]MDO6445430.1 hypothetical protein [Colwellia sp. 1_MG-2023]
MYEYSNELMADLSGVSLEIMIGNSQTEVMHYAFDNKTGVNIKKVILMSNLTP